MVHAEFPNAGGKSVLPVSQATILHPLTSAQAYRVAFTDIGTAVWYQTGYHRDPSISEAKGCPYIFGYGLCYSALCVKHLLVNAVSNQFARTGPASFPNEPCVGGRGDLQPKTLKFRGPSISVPPSCLPE